MYILPRRWIPGSLRQIPRGRRAWALHSLLERRERLLASVASPAAVKPAGRSISANGRRHRPAPRYRRGSYGRVGSRKIERPSRLRTRKPSSSNSQLQTPCESEHIRVNSPPCSLRAGCPRTRPDNGGVRAFRESPRASAQLMCQFRRHPSSAPLLRSTPLAGHGDGRLRQACRDRANSARPAVADLPKAVYCIPPPLPSAASRTRGKHATPWPAASGTPSTCRPSRPT